MSGRLRLSIRLKLLVLMAGIMLVSVGSYLLLATALTARDQLAYAYNLNQNMAATLSAQVRTLVDSMETKLALFGGLATASNDAAARDALAERFIDADPSIVRLQLYTRDKGGAFALAVDRVVEQRLAPLELNPGDFALIDRQTPLPLDAAAGAGEHLVVTNRSLPPSAALVSFVVFDRANRPPRWAAEMDASQEQLATLFGNYSIYSAALVDVDGRVVSHADRGKVIKRENLAGVPAVMAAVQSQGALGGAREYTSRDGRDVLGAYAHVGRGRLHVVSEIDRVTALAGAEQLKRVSGLFGIAVVLAALLACIFFSRVLTTPVRRLRAATQELAAGRYDVDPGVRSRDEIGDLARDFTAMAKRIREAQDKLIQSEKMAAFGQLTAGITHEVRNPLSVISGYAELGLSSGAEGKSTREAFEHIAAASARCLEILNDLLTFTRSETGVRAALELNAVVADSLKMVGVQLRTARVHLHTAYMDSPPKVVVNARQIQQVILNLALNAQQAMDKGGNVHVTTRLDGGFAEIEIRDDGPGIPQDIQARIFEPFFTTKAPGKGTGLGLSVSFGIVHAHGGELRVASEPGKGTAFTVQLPVSDENRVS